MLKENTIILSQLFQSPEIFNAIVLFSFLFAPTAGALPCRLIAMPFTIDATGDLSSLNNGIYETLCTRLMRKDTVIIPGRDTIQQALQNLSNYAGANKAFMLGISLKADYVVSGSLQVKDTIVDIEMNLLDISGKQPTAVFTRSCRNKDEVLQVVNQMVREIYPFIVAIPPEKSIDSSAPVLKAQPSDTAPRVESFNPVKDSAKIPSGREAAGSFWKSPVLPVCINGISFFDMDNDGKQEVCILTDKEVQMYRFENKELIKVASIAGIKYRKPVSIDIADLNGNHLPEIYIGAFDRYLQNVISMVYEFDGTKSATLIRNTQWFSRVISIKDSSKILIGQQHTIGDLFSGSIVQLQLENRKLRILKELVPSCRLNVLGSTCGTLMNSDQNSVTGYNKSGRIIIVSGKGEKIGQSEETYSGSTFYGKYGGKDADQEYEYLPVRIIADDINNDGKKEIIAIKNHEMVHDIFSKFKHYNSGYIEILGWNGLTFKSIWKSGSLSGFIRDFAVSDFDNDGKLEIVAAFIYKEGSFIFSKPKSVIVAYKL
jgi:TolB-like protein